MTATAPTTHRATFAELVHAGTMAQPVEADDVRRPREVQLLLEQLAAVGLTLAPLRGPTEQEQLGVDLAIGLILQDTSGLASGDVEAVRAAGRWWRGRPKRQPSNSALRRAVGIAGSYHVALAELRGRKQCPGGRWPKCEGQLEAAADPRKRAGILPIGWAEAVASNCQPGQTPADVIAAELNVSEIEIDDGAVWDGTRQQWLDQDQIDDLVQRIG
jgi:hypothetical protein